MLVGVLIQRLRARYYIKDAVRIVGAKTPIRHSRRVQVAFETPRLNRWVACWSTLEGRSGLDSMLHDWKQWISFRAPFFSWKGQADRGLRKHFHPESAYLRAGRFYCAKRIEPRCEISKRELTSEIRKDFFLDVRIFWIWGKYTDFCIS